MSRHHIPAILLFFLGVLARLLPHAANVAPITAIALFGALYLPRRQALAIPVAAMLVGDIIIGFYSLPIMASVYGSFLASAGIGFLVKKRKSFGTVLVGILASSVVFFLATNAAVWAFGTLYAHTLAGLFESYAMAVPFFRNSITGDIMYTGLLVGGMEFAIRKKYVSSRTLKDADLPV